MNIDQIKQRASESLERIVLPEATDLRVLEAASQIKKENFATPVLIGNKNDTLNLANANGINLQGIDIIAPDNRYQDLLFEKRKTKGMTYEEAKDVSLDPVYFGTLMIESNHAEGLVSGSIHSSADTLRPALQIIKSDPNDTVSTYFVMQIKNQTYFFADCALVANPNARELSQIATSTADSVKAFGIEPVVAMLSYSTQGSGVGPDADKVREATKLAQERRPDLQIYGELQADAAIVSAVAEKKSKGDFQGNANTLIFPDLNSANIGYKLVERLANAKAIGPITQGLDKPVNDLSRGCSVNDIVEVAAITAIYAKK